MWTTRPARLLLATKNSAMITDGSRSCKRTAEVHDGEFRSTLYLQKLSLLQLNPLTSQASHPSITPLWGTKSLLGFCGIVLFLIFPYFSWFNSCYFIRIQSVFVAVRYFRDFWFGRWGEASTQHWNSGYLGIRKACGRAAHWFTISFSSTLFKCTAHSHE